MSDGLQAVDLIPCAQHAEKSKHQGFLELDNVVIGDDESNLIATVFKHTGNKEGVKRAPTRAQDPCGRFVCSDSAAYFDRS